MSDPARLYDAILTGDPKAAEEAAKATLETGADPQELLNKYMIPAMDEAGRRFECYDYFINEVLVAARAMKAAMEQLAPHLAQAGAEAARSLALDALGRRASPGRAIRNHRPQRQRRQPGSEDSRDRQRSCRRPVHDHRRRHRDAGVQELLGRRGARALYR